MTRPSRKIVERVFITGTLVLETPASFGNGNSTSLTDLALARDPLTNQPLLTGASIAGALRNYLREVEKGYGWAEERRARNKSYAEKLFGHLNEHERESTAQSWLMVDDAVSTPPALELRDGVTLDPATRTAEDKKKYDLELLAAGTTFPLQFEVGLNAEGITENWLGALVTALRGLEQGHIGLGARKRRGLGVCRMTNWQYTRYTMSDPAQYRQWLDNAGSSQPGLPKADMPFHDARQALRLHAEFTLAEDSSLLIRATGGPADMQHLRSGRNGVQTPILSGTSLAGALRGRALRIAKTMRGDKNGEALVNALFGKRITASDSAPSGSQVIVHEAVIKNGLTDYVQNRVKIDHFTGGAFPTGLFSEQPVFPNADGQTRLAIDLELRRKKAEPKDDAFEAQAGLLLLTLKDLWLGDLPVGGESSVGRGRLAGQTATLTYGDQTWQIAANGQVGGASPHRLNDFVSAFQNYVAKTKEAK